MVERGTLSSLDSAVSIGEEKEYWEFSLAEEKKNSAECVSEFWTEEETGESAELERGARSRKKAVRKATVENTLPRTAHRIFRENRHEEGDRGAFSWGTASF